MKTYVCVLSLCLSFQLASGQTGIATDGTVGPAAQSLTPVGGAYTIGQDLGERSGNNLFHSFDQFNIGTGESVTFTGDNDIQNVISRVTGGSVSSIDGLLASTIGTADFYFINPAGVLFGPNATLDLPGAFHVSTADYIRLGDSDLFYSEPLEGEVLSTAAPAAFGFLDEPADAAVGDITVDGTSLKLVEGETLSLVGGSIEVTNGAQLSAAGGQVNLVGLSRLSGDAVFTTQNGDLAVSDLSDSGSILVDAGSVVDVDGSGGGRIFIRSGQVFVEDSRLSAQTSGDRNGKDIDVEASANVSLMRSLIDTRTQAEGTAGDIRIAADTVVFDLVGAASEVGIFSGVFMELWAKLDIEHDYNSDLIAQLTSPSNTTIILFSEVGGEGENFSETILRDDATVSINDGSAPFAGNYRPQESLGTFLSEDLNGVWTLRIEDDSFFDDGNLKAWSLTVNEQTFNSADVPKTIEGGLFSSITESNLNVTGLANLSETKAGNVTIDTNQLSIFTSPSETFRIDARSVRAENVGVINMLAGQVMLNGLDASFKVDSGTGIFRESRIVLDGTLFPENDGLALGGPDYSIDASYGKLMGSNLFHSFRDFLIDQDETATFFSMENTEISNILVRVTGDKATDIYGTLRSSVENANLYLLNPNGFLFGENASVDLSGSFYVSTANYLSLGTTKVFDISSPSNSTIDGSEPTAFGFVDDSAGKITINGPSLELGAGRTLSLVGGDINLSNGNVLSESGQINIVSVGSDQAGTVLFGGNETAFETTGFTSYGTIFLESHNLDVSGELAGSIYIRGENLTLDNQASLNAITRGGNSGESGGDIVIDIDDHLQIFNDGRIDVSTRSFGNGGKVMLHADRMTIDGQGSSSFTGITSQADALVIGGNSGELDIAVSSDLQILNGGRIDVGTLSLGNGGKVKLQADRLIIDGQDSFSFTGIASRANSLVIGGNGGELDITVSNDLQILNGGKIDVGTLSLGNGGKVKLQADRLIIDGQGSSSFTGIASQARTLVIGGNSGELDITVINDLQILNGGKIDVSTFSIGNGGKVRLQADRLKIDGQGSSSFTGIASQARSGSLFIGGNGGGLDITVSDDLQVLNGGRIDVSTFSEGNGGNVTVRTENLTIDRQGSSSFTGIASQASSEATGNSGNLTIIAKDRLEVMNAGSITSSTNSPGTAGSVTIDGGDLLLENGGKILSSSNNTDSPIDDLPDAGAIQINMSGNVWLKGGSEIASSSRLSNAGTIKLLAEGAIEIDSSTVSISAGQGILDEEVRSNTRFTLNDPNGDLLNSFLSGFTPPELQIESGSTIRITDSDIDARAGLLAGSVRLKAADKIIVNNSDLSLEVDQRAMKLAGSWNTFRDETSGAVDGDAFSKDFPELFLSSLTLEAENAIQIVDSTLTTNAGLAAKALDLADSNASKVRGFGGSIEMNVPLVFPTLIELSNSTLEAQSYTMGGNVIIDPYYYVVNNSDIITSADIIGGDYIINAAFLLQSLDSIVDLSGQQSGSFVSSAVDVDLGSELSELKAELLNLESFVQASCDLYYLKKRSSFIVKPTEIRSSDFDDYLPSGLPDYLNESGFTPSDSGAGVLNGENLPPLNNDCIDCI